MKRIAFVFSTASHGTTAGQEGSDVSLAASALTDDLAASFIADGVFQLLPGQKPDVALARDYIATFKLLGLYDIEQCWIRAASLRERGLDPQTPFVARVTPLETDTLRYELVNYNVTLKFRGVMLHTLRRPPWLMDFAALLRLLDEGDELPLLRDGVTATVDGNRYLESPRNAPIKVYVPNENLIARGLTGRTSNDIISIDYTDFVGLTVKHSSQMVW